MQTATSRLTLSQLASHVRSALAAVESAQDEAAATEAFSALKAAIEHQLTRTEELKKAYYKQKDAIEAHAADSAEGEAQPAGERAPQPPGEANVTLNLPEVIAIESRPNCLFVRLSFGLVNLLQIALLDVKGKTLYLNSGNVLKLESEDVRRLVYHTKLFIADAPTGTNPTT